MSFARLSLSWLVSLGRVLALLGLSLRKELKKNKYIRFPIRSKALWTSFCQIMNDLHAVERAQMLAMEVNTAVASEFSPISSRKPSFEQSKGYLWALYGA